MKTPRFTLKFTVALALFAGMLASIQAATLIDYSTGFANSSNLDLNGSGVVVSGTTLQFSGAASSSVFYKTKIDVTQDFTVTFLYTGANIDFGKGLTFMIQNDTRGTDALGDGFGGAVDNGVAPTNTAVSPSATTMWAQGYGMGYVSNTSSTATGIPNFGAGQNGDRLNGTNRTAMLDYNAATNILKVYANGVQYGGNISLNLSSLVGSTAYFGFGLQLAGGDDSLTLQNWVVTSPVPEPSTMAMISFGTLGMIFLRRRRK